MIKMEYIGEQDFGDFVPESLFEAIDQINNGGKSRNTNSGTANNSLDEFMDFELDLSSENCTMTSFLELEQEISEAPVTSQPLIRPSVIVKASSKPTVAQPSLTDIMDSCGIDYDLPEDFNLSSPSSIHSDVQLEQNKELIEELEEFFIKTEGKPTVVEEPVLLSLPGLDNNLMTADGQNVIIILGPESPTESLPTDRKERKKAQNRTAAFRYREKKKTEQDSAEEELEALEDKNIRLKEKLSEMETEFKYLKKLMVEAGLGKYTAAVKF